MRTITLMIIYLIVGLVVGGIIVDSLSKPVTEYVEVPVEVIKEVEVERIVIKTVYQEVPLIKEVEVVKEVIKHQDIYDRQWESVKQFTDWYYTQDFKALFPSSDYKVDCDDYAERLQIYALRQGYPVSVALSNDGTYYGVKVTEKNHAANLVEINGVYYFVDMRPGVFGITKVVNRD